MTTPRLNRSFEPTNAVSQAGKAASTVFSSLRYDPAGMKLPTSFGGECATKCNVPLVLPRLISSLLALYNKSSLEIQGIRVRLYGKVRNSNLQRL